MKLLLWNVEWNNTERKRKFIQSTIAKEMPDVWCLTEATDFYVESIAHAISSTADYGYPLIGGRRKVWLFSRSEWNDVSTGKNLPPGRFISGVTNDIRFVGVCVPWFNAHVANGNRNRRQWEDHLSFLAGLKPILETYAKESPVCVIGDFNQRVPATAFNSQYVPHLLDALSVGYKLDTQGITDIDGETLIDHIATTHEIEFRLVRTIGRRADRGRPVSDHPGIIGELQRNNAIPVE